MQSKKSIFLNKLSLAIFLLTLFVSLFFFIPFSPITLEASKGFLVSIGVPLSLVFWLIARLEEGRFQIPKDRLIIFGAAIPLVFIISSLFSFSLSDSLFGSGFEVGTFGTVITLFITFFLSAVHFQTEKRLWLFMGVIFLGAIILAIFELLNIFVGLGSLFPNFFQGISSGNLIGNWSNFIIFFGLVVLLLEFMLGFLKTKKIFRLAQIILLIASLLFLVFVSVPLVWLLVCIFSIIIFAYNLSLQYAEIKMVNSQDGRKKFPFISLIIVLISLAFLIAGGSLNNLISKYVNIPNVDIRPTVMTTNTIALKSLGHNPILGTGPNTFSTDWSLWHPLATTQGLFWNIDFVNGFSFLQTILVTTGLLGFLTVLLFIIVLFIRGIQSLRIALQNPLINYFIVTTLLVTFYSWMIIIFYNPNIIMLMLAFVGSGVLLGVLVYKKVANIKEISFLNNLRNSFLGIIGIIILLIGTLSLVYVYTKKFTALVYYSRSIVQEVNTDSLAKSERMLLRAIGLNNNDIYFRNLSQVYLAQISLVIQDEKISTEELQTQVQELIISAEVSAQQAINQNPKKYLNYINLGNVYGSFIPLNIQGSYEKAVEAFEKAKEFAPNNPAILLARAQLELLNKKSDEAKKFIHQALEMKPNYTEASNLLSQIEKQANQ